MVRVQRVGVDRQLHRAPGKRWFPEVVSDIGLLSAGSIEIRSSSFRCAHVAATMRIEELLAHACADLTLFAARIHWRIFIHRTTARAPQHVQVIQDNQPRAGLAGGSNQIIRISWQN
jgi:hypothetical protein